MSQKEKLTVTWDEQTQKYIKKMEVIEEDLSDESIMNEYLGAVKERNRLLEDLSKNSSRLEVLDAEFTEIFNEFQTEYTSLNREGMKMDELKVLDEIKNKYDLLAQIRKYYKENSV